MNIQFSQAAAQQACDSLTEQSLNIAKNTEELFELVEAIRTVWEGDLATKVITGLTGHREYLGQVKSFVTYLDKHIATCKHNYKLTESVAKARTEEASKMFL